MPAAYPIKFHAHGKPGWHDTHATAAAEQKVAAAPEPKTELKPKAAPDAPKED
jgi:hypothetical protein